MVRRCRGRRAARAGKAQGLQLPPPHPRVGPWCCRSCGAALQEPSDRDQAEPSHAGRFPAQRWLARGARHHFAVRRISNALRTRRRHRAAHGAAQPERRPQRRGPWHEQRGGHSHRRDRSPPRPHVAGHGRKRPARCVPSRAIRPDHPLRAGHRLRARALGAQARGRRGRGARGERALR